MEDTTDYKKYYFKVQHEAVQLADEVDRLTAENKALRESLDKAHKKIARITAENEALYEAIGNPARPALLQDEKR